MAALRDEVARLRQALRAAGQQETRSQEATAAERLRHAGEMAASEGRTAEARIDAKVGWDKAAAVGAELGRVVAEGVACLRVSQAGVAALERSNAALTAGQATIAAREAELRRILDSALSLAILATDPDGQVVFWNAGAERLLAPDPGGAVPPSFAEAAPFDDDPDGSIGRGIAAALRGERMSAEAWPLRRGGERLWLGVEAMPIEDGVAGLAGVLWLLHDRTETHAAELARRESEAKYRALFDTVDEGFCIVEVIFDAAGRAEDYRFHEVNAAFERLTGLRGAVGRRARKLAPALEEHWFETYGRVALTGEPARFVNHTTSLGDRWYDVRAFRIGPAALRRVAVLFDDITDMRRAEEALRESEARHRALVTTTSYATYRMSADWSEMLALDGRGILADSPRSSRNWVEAYILSEDQPLVWAAIRDAIAAKRLFELEHRVRLVDGSVGWTLSRAVPLLDETGDIREWFGAASDVTARHHAEEALAADLAATNLLRDLAERLVTEENLQAIHEEILSAAISLTRADAGTVQVYDPATQSLVLLVTRNFARKMTDHFRHVDVGSRTACGIALRSGRRTFVDFDEADTDEACVMHVEAGYRSAQATPLLTRTGRPIGMINTHWHAAGHRPTERELRFLDLLVRQAADLIDQREAQRRLRESEERQAYLLRLSDALRPLADPVAIQEAATRLLGSHLSVSRAVYVEFFHENGRDTVVIEREHRAPGAMSFAGPHDAEQFGPDLPALRAGHTIAVGDIEAEPSGETLRAVWRALGVRARLGIPLLKDGRLVAGLGVYDAVARTWTPEEITLVAETGERTWAAVERARAEAALRESEARFRGFAENSADVLWITNGDGTRLSYLSPAFETVFGEPRDRILADLGRFAELVHPDDRAAVAGFLPRTLAGETAIAHYRVVRPSDGSTVHLRDTGFPIRGADGTITRAAGVVQDVTDLHEAAMAREAEKERFRTLAEGIPELVWRSAAHGRWTWASPQWAAFTGQAGERSHGRGWLDAVHAADREAAEVAWDESEALGLYQADFRLRHAGSGRYAWFQTRGVPLRDGRGTVVEWIGACANIDDQVRAREALARSAEELDARVQERTAELMAAEAALHQAQKMEAIGQLTGGIAHDFNNMLQGIVGGLDMARRRMAEGRTADAERYTDAARDAANRAAGLTRRLLAFARRQQLEPRPVDTDALVRDMEELVRRSVGPAVSIEFRLRDGAGPVLCDPSELESAVLNLCINARDAMPGGGRLTVAIGDVQLSAAEIGLHEAARPGDFVSIRVEDTGTGMTPEVLEHVLEPFFTTKPQGEGTGLGLSQVYGFVRQSGGVLRIDSTPGRGTSVQILLPHAAVAAGAAGTEKGSAAVRSARGDTILLVDDEMAVRMPAAERLRDLGYRVVEAPDGPSAMRLLTEGLRPDILVTDVGLPNGMNGRAVAQEIRRYLAGLPVVFATGYAGVALPDDAAVVTKPFDLDALAARINEALHRDR